jgi:diguanylate cyclase (GGDEF)-like protein
MAILIVDDREDDAFVLTMALKTAGYADVCVARSGLEAIALLTEHPELRSTIEVVLMDVSMPGVDGIETCRRLKTKGALGHVPVVMVTGKDTPETLADAFAAGACDFVAKPFDYVELQTRVGSALARKRELDEHDERERDLERQARLDPLTGIANRRAFDETFETEWRRMQREGDRLALLMVDVDEFKPYNDAHGHVAGDQRLVEVARVLKTSLHRAGDFAARYGGEEFVVLLPHTDAGGARAIAEQLRAGVEALAIPRPGGTLTVSAGGAALVPTAVTPKESLVVLADQALYAAKRAGRNRVVVTDVPPTSIPFQAAS